MYVPALVSMRTELSTNNVADCLFLMALNKSLAYKAKFVQLMSITIGEKSCGLCICPNAGILSNSGFAAELAKGSVAFSLASMRVNGCVIRKACCVGFLKTNCVVMVIPLSQFILKLGTLSITNSLPTCAKLRKELSVYIATPIPVIHAIAFAAFVIIVSFGTQFFCVAKVARFILMREKSD